MKIFDKISSTLKTPVALINTAEAVAATESGVEATDQAVRCSNCEMRNICMPDGLDASAYAKIDAVICTSKRIAGGDTLYHAGTPFTNLYVVRVGALKTIATLPGDLEQITRFDVSGDALGFDGVYNGIHTSNTIALEDSVVCVIPFHLFELLCNEIPVLQRHLLKTMSGEIVRESRRMLMLSKLRAEQRVIIFLVALSQQMKERGYSPSELNLRMSRQELASYLGMKIETVSRSFSRIQCAAVIQIHGRFVRILDMDRLMALSL